MKRKYDTKGDEIEPDLSNKKKVNTGYLMSSYSVYSIYFFCCFINFFLIFNVNPG